MMVQGLMVADKLIKPKAYVQYLTLSLFSVNTYQVLSII